MGTNERKNEMWKMLLSITMVIAFSIAVASSYTAVAHDDDFDDELTVIVFPDLGTFSLIDVDKSGGFSAGDPFVIQGTLLNENMTAEIGRYLCRGWFIADPISEMPPFFDGEFTFVHQSFEIFDRGTIHVEGNESTNSIVRAIDGVSGDFELEEGGTLLAEPMGVLGVFVIKATFRFDD